MCTPPIDFAVSGANIFVCPVNILLRCFRWLFSLKPFPCNILSYSDCILLTEWATLHISPSCFVVSFWLPYNILYIVKYSSDRLWIHFPLPCLCVRHKLFSESAILLEHDRFYIVFAFRCFFRVFATEVSQTQTHTELFSLSRAHSLSLPYILYHVARLAQSLASRFCRFSQAVWLACVNNCVTCIYV